MNKTVSINLGGIFFHIDEDAYTKLKRYLEAIKRSFHNTESSAEIISDIETRISELFSERMKHDKQVVGVREVDEIIEIMGQPEEYIVEDMFDSDNTTSSTSQQVSKKLFRDRENRYIGGVASGMAHYLGVDAVWIRLAWVLLLFGSAGTIILIYFLLWFFVPEARTTAEKLTMKGKAVNISNIEKKIKDGFNDINDTISEKMKDVDIAGAKNKIQSGSKTLFDSIGEIFAFFLKLCIKGIGLILVIFSVSILITLIITFFSASFVNVLNIAGIDLMHINNLTGAPMWSIALLSVLVACIPFIFLFYLGLKILVNNLRSLGTLAKFSLLGLWIISIIGLSIMGVTQANAYSNNASDNHKFTLNTNSTDTLYVKMSDTNPYNTYNKRFQKGIKIVQDPSGQKLIYLTSVKLAVKSTRESMAYINVEKRSRGRDFQEAQSYAQQINYTYTIEDNVVVLDHYFTTPMDIKYRDQEVELTLYLPENSVFKADKNTSKFHISSSSYDDLLGQGMEGHFLKVIENSVNCLDCESQNYSNHLKSPHLNMDEDSLDYSKSKTQVKINKDGIKASSDSLNISIGKDGIKITSP